MQDIIMTRRERIEARRAYFEKEENRFGLSSAIPIKVSIEYDAKIELLSSIVADPPEREVELSPPRPRTIGERARLLSNKMSDTTVVASSPVVHPEVVRPDTVYHALSVMNIEGCDCKEDVYRLILYRCPYKIKSIYVSEAKKHAFVDFFREDDADDMVKRLDHHPFHNYILDVKRIVSHPTS